MFKQNAKAKNDGDDNEIRITIVEFYRWMDDLRFYILFKSISVISGRCLDDNESLYAMELRLRLRSFHPERESNSVR